MHVGQFGLRINSGLLCIQDFLIGEFTLISLAFSCGTPHVHGSQVTQTGWHCWFSINKFQKERKCSLYTAYIMLEITFQDLWIALFYSFDLTLRGKRFENRFSFTITAWPRGSSQKLIGKGHLKQPVKNNQQSCHFILTCESNFTYFRL